MCMEDDQESSFSLEDDPIEGINDVTISNNMASTWLFLTIYINS